MKKLLNVFAISLLVAAPAFAGWNPFSKAAEAAKDCEGHKNLPEAPAPQPEEIQPEAPAGMPARAAQWIPASTQGKVLAVAGVAAVGGAAFGGYQWYKKHYGKPAVVEGQDAQVAAEPAVEVDAAAQPAVEADAAAQPAAEVVPSKWAVVVPGKKAAMTAGAAVVGGGMYKFGAYDYLKGVDYRAVGTSLVEGGMHNWKTITGVTAGLLATTGVAYKVLPKLKKWNAKRSFVKAIQAKVAAYIAKVDADGQIEDADKLTQEWIKEIAPVCCKQQNGDVKVGLNNLIFGRTENDRRSLIALLAGYTKNGDMKAINTRMGSIVNHVSNK